MCSTISEISAFLAGFLLWQLFWMVGMTLVGLQRFNIHWPDVKAIEKSMNFISKSGISPFIATGCGVLALYISHFFQFHFVG